MLKTPFTPEGCSSTLHSSDEALRVLRAFPNASSHAVGASLCEYPQHHFRMADHPSEMSGKRISGRWGVRHVHPNARLLLRFS